MATEFTAEVPGAVSSHDAKTSTRVEIKLARPSGVPLDRITWSRLTRNDVAHGRVLDAVESIRRPKSAVG